MNRISGNHGGILPVNLPDSKDNRDLAGIVDHIKQIKIRPRTQTQEQRMKLSTVKKETKELPQLQCESPKFGCPMAVRRPSKPYMHIKPPRYYCPVPRNANTLLSVQRVMTPYEVSSRCNVHQTISPRILSPRNACLPSKQAQPVRNIDRLLLFS